MFTGICINGAICIILNCLYYQTGAKRIVSVDANFGLCRKKAAGTSIRLPLHNGTFFLIKQKWIVMYHSTKDHGLHPLLK